MIESRGGTRPIVLAGRRATEVAIPRIEVTVESGPESGHVALLNSTSLRIGTHPESDLVLTDPTASRRHAMLTLTPEGMLVEDLGSRNGTWINGARIRAAYVSDDGVIQLGSTALRVRFVTSQFTVIPDQPRLGEMIGASSAMKDVFALVRQLARTDLPVLVTGETGTGKELIARALHEEGPRRSQPFLVLDCGAIVPDLLRSEIFGHEKGAFTGADRASPGILEEAQGGTVQLDEIGEIPLAVQPQLLRALEIRHVTRLGSRRTIPVDFRVVAATNRDLAAMSRDGSFRADLYYRLSCVTIKLPPLRDRKEDILPVAQSFLEKCAARNGLSTPALAESAVRALEDHSWPGNVRELRNVMEAACLLSAGNPISAERLTSVLGQAGANTGTAGSAVSLRSAERTTIESALKAAAGNLRQAARSLGISRSTLYEKMRRYGLERPDK